MPNIQVRDAIFIRKYSQPSLATTCAKYISDYTQKEPDGLKKEFMSRIGVVAMPFMTSSATIQYLGILLSDTARMAFKWDWDTKILRDDLVDLIKMIVATVAQILVCPLSFFDPSIYKRPDEIPPIDPKDLQIDRLKGVIASKDRTISSRETTISDRETTISDREREIIALMLPSLITLENFDNTLNTINRIPGVTARKLGSGNTLSTCCSDDNFEDIRIEKFDKSLTPPDTIEFQFDLTDPNNHDLITKFLTKPHYVNRVIVKGTSAVEFLLNLPTENTPLHRIHTLVLKDVEFTKDELESIEQKFPQIDCYNWKDATLDSEVPGFGDRHICITPTENNIQKWLNHLNNNLNYMFDKLKSEFRPEIFTEFFSSNLKQPAAPFITNVRFLSGLETLHDKHLYRIQNNLLTLFPNMSSLDLSNCNRLTIEVLRVLTDFHLKKIHLNNASKFLLYKGLDLDDTTSFQKVEALLGSKSITMLPKYKATPF